MMKEGELETAGRLVSGWAGVLVCPPLLSSPLLSSLLLWGRRLRERLMEERELETADRRVDGQTDGVVEGKPTCLSAFRRP